MTNYTVIQGSFHELEWTAVWICCTAYAAHRQVMPGFAHSIMLVCLSDKFSNHYNVARLIRLWPNNTLFRAYLFSNHFKGLTWVQKRNMHYHKKLHNWPSVQSLLNLMNSNSLHRQFFNHQSMCTMYNLNHATQWSI